MKFKESITYDDMLIVPRYSDIVSRSEVDIGNSLGDEHFTLPRSVQCADAARASPTAWAEA